jgi:pilus assembly protein CpaF
VQFTPDAIDMLFTVLRSQFHYVIADVPRIPTPAYRRAFEIADRRVIVVDQTMRSMRDAVRLKQGTRDFRAHPASQMVFMEGEIMTTIGFGRRVVETPSRSIMLVPETTDETQGLGVRADFGRTELKDQIREELLKRIDPAAASRVSRRMLQAQIAIMVSEIATEQKVQLNELEEAALAAELTDDMVGLGPLEPLLQDDTVTDILVNGYSDIYVERRGKLEKTPARFRDTQHVVNVAQRIAMGVGRRIDESSPMVDARLADGSRVNIVLPPLVLNGGTISIRKFPTQNITLETMVSQGNISAEMAQFLDIAARCRVNILISGGTGSGKTTLLNAVSRHIDTDERIITIEDAVELRLQQPHVVQMETRPPNIEGVGHIPQRELVRNALRMRPDRIIVGEVRGNEAFDMLQAMNTGHDGSMSTIHANTPRDALFRLENMVLMASGNLPLRALRAQIASAINIIVQIARMRDGIRRIERICEISGMEGEIVSTRDIFTFQHQGENRDGIIQGTFEPSKLRPDLAEKAAQYGLERQLLSSVGISPTLITVS